MIDEQHKQWFDKAEALFDAGRKGQAKEYIGELLQFLDDYTKKHFADEERYMLKINYPGYDEQKKGAYGLYWAVKRSCARTMTLPGEV